MPAALARAATRWACAYAWCVGTLAIAAPPSLPDFALDNPAPGVYVHYGRNEATAPANAGDIANNGFVVGTRCVAVVDTGGTYAVGRALREAIRRVTPLPVCFVVNTHAHPDHVFGNAAFMDDHPVFVGHTRLADALRRRGPSYLHALMRDLGDAAEGSVLVLPTRAVADTDRLDLGGRVLTLRAWRTAHTDCDLSVSDDATRTLWLGDLLFVDHLPVVDGSLRGFLAVIGELETTRADRAIAGHGRAPSWPDAIVPERRYLERLAADVRAAIAAGRTLAEAVDAVGATGQWLLVDEFHKRNVTAAYAELEWER
jgi:quinoprotein relay system zinc metallohydrolase 2